MSQEALDNALNTIFGLEATIDYLETNSDIIIDSIIKEILESNENYLYELKRGNNLTEFENSLHKHFQWMIDFSNNPDEDEVPFDDTYTLGDINLYLAYCAFYQNLLLFINDINDTSIQNYMTQLCNFLVDEYCN